MIPANQRPGRAMLVCCSLALLSGRLAAQERLNVLFVVADDQSAFDLSVYDKDSTLETPVINRLAAAGMTLDAAYHMGSWSGAVCTPSRYMIMSGRTLWHLPHRGIKGEAKNPHCPDALETLTLPAVFKRAGFETMRTCKKHNSYEAANEQFAVRKDATKREGNDENGSAWHADQVLDFLADRKIRKSEAPFFIYLGFSHPHDPRWAKDELAKKYGAHNTEIPKPPHPSAPPLPANYLPAHP
ncbi:MAG: sulfatase-like hydrolase/transferase, partial [Planctomycetes bacterium]|nr:sulfatase-like hydrolase/transferase [Planctomycetota bacterium]